MEDALRTLQQQVSAPQNHNAALETQLRSQLGIAQGLAELPGAITMVRDRAQKLERDACRSVRLGKATGDLRQGRRLHVWVTKVENASGVFRNVRGALSFAMESQDAVTEGAVALGVSELDVCREKDNSSQCCQPSRTGEKCDVASSAGGDRGSESCSIHKMWDLYTTGDVHEVS